MNSKEIRKTGALKSRLRLPRNARFLCFKTPEEPHAGAKARDGDVAPTGQGAPEAPASQDESGEAPKQARPAKRGKPSFPVHDPQDALTGANWAEHDFSHEALMAHNRYC